MLYPCEVTHSEGNLTVDCPDDASKHGGPHNGHVGGLTSCPEGLVVEDNEVKEENDHGGIEAVSHPPKYPIPVKEQVFWPLLIKCWELQNARGICKHDKPSKYNIEIRF